MTLARVMRTLAISFDVWGTLLDIRKFYQILSVKIAAATGRPYEEVYRRVLETYREAITKRLEGGFRRIVIDSAAFFAERLGIDIEVLFRSLARALDDEDTGSLVYEDVPETLERIRGRGHRTALVGNVMFWSGMVTRYILHRNRILDYFDATVFSDEIGSMKPGREIFEYVSQRTGVALRDTIHVGDSVEHDLAGAVLNGMYSVLIKRGLGTPVLRLDERTYVISSMRDLIRVVEDIERGL